MTRSSQQSINMWDGISCCYIYFIPILFIIVCFLSQNILYLLQAAMSFGFLPLLFGWSLLILPTYPQSPCYQGKNDFWGLFRKIKISVKNISLIQVYPWFYQFLFYSFFMLWYNLTVSQIWSSIFFKYLIFKGYIMSHWLISIIFK